MSPKTTYIVPVRIESPDRKRNFLICIRYLLSNTDGKIIVKEADDMQRVTTFFPEIIDNPRIKYLFERDSGTFHRTKYLNDMLDLVDTEITCNYDCDVILHPFSYTKSESMILKEEIDVVYPFPKSKTGQVKMFLEEADEKRIIQNPEPGSFGNCKTDRARARYGFCFFIKTATYKLAGGEHEGFVSWGPEDEERVDRFSKLGLSISRIQDFPVFHMEHERGVDSVMHNPFFKQNEKLWKKLKKMSAMDRLENIILCNAREWRS